LLDVRETLPGAHFATYATQASFDDFQSYQP
jgi:hypothetical protein